MHSKTWDNICNRLVYWATFDVSKSFLKGFKNSAQLIPIPNISHPEPVATNSCSFSMVDLDQSFTFSVII